MMPHGDAVLAPACQCCFRSCPPRSSVALNTLLQRLRMRSLALSPWAPPLGIFLRPRRCCAIVSSSINKASLSLSLVTCLPFKKKNQPTYQGRGGRAKGQAEEKRQAGETLFSFLLPSPSLLIDLDPSLVSPPW
jgi:hypothetical protein